MSASEMSSMRYNCLCLGGWTPAFLLFTLAGLTLSGSTCLAQTSVPPAPSTLSSLSYDQMVERARALISARPQEALQISGQAIQKDPSRYEGHVIAAALRWEKEYVRASVHLRVAMALAPDEEKPGLSHAIAEMKVASLPSESRRRLDALMLVLEDALAAQSLADREKFQREFLARSETLLATYPAVSDLWAIRAQIAIDLDEPVIGSRAGGKLIELGEDRSENPAIRKLLARLERNGWLSGNLEDAVPALVSAFNARIRAIGVQQFHGFDFLKNSVDTTNSLSELSGDCKNGLDTTESRLTATKGDGALRPDSFYSKLENQRLTILAGDVHFNALISQSDPSRPSGGYAFAIGVAPVRTHDATVHSVVRNSEGASESNDPIKGWLWPANSNYVILFSNNRADLQFLADTLTKIHLACMNGRQ
jgi:hypothetical protein